MPSYTLRIKPEVQLDTMLCWAAASVMAIRSFPQRNGFRHATQEEVVVYERAGIDALLPKTPRRPDLQKLLADARRAFRDGVANAPSNPWLLGLDKTMVSDIAQGRPRMLSREHFRQEIGIRKRPVLIRWVYGSVNHRPGARAGAHELVVTGYNSKTHELRIWDPWPAVGMADPHPERRERWIPYSKYVDPVSAAGVKVKAMHDFDEFALRLKHQPFEKDNYPALVAVPRKRPRQAQEHAVRGQRARKADEIADLTLPDHDFAGPIREFMKSHVIRKPNGQKIPRPFTAGEPIPIVPLTTRELLRARHNPAAVLRRRSPAVMVPILKRDKVIDSFLLLYRRGRWVEGGYSNNEIAHRVTQWCRSRANCAPCKDFFLLAIPEQGRFYLANGYHDEAHLLSLNDDGKGDFIPAAQVLQQLARKARQHAKTHRRTARSAARTLK